MRLGWAFSLALAGVLVSQTTQAALIDQVNQAFRSVNGRTPTVAEWNYWAGRVQRGEKKTYAALAGAMAYQRAHGQETAVPAVSTGTAVAASASFKTGKSEYPSPFDPNFLPDGVLLKSTASPEVYVLVGGKKSWVLPSLVNKWLGENHYFKHDVVVTISPEDMARYPQTRSVNYIYSGKVLAESNGVQYFIDDKLRKRELTAAVRARLRIPGGNLYQTSAAHLREFATGPKLAGDKYPGGMVVYTGAYHGGQIWRIKEAGNGQLLKHVYASDYLYEADGNPDESLRAPADAALLAKHPRGTNIERYPDGWVVGLGGKTYVVQGGKLRHIATPELFNAMGLRSKYVLTVYPEFLRRYPKGNAIRAFKTVVTDGAIKTTSATAAPSTTGSLTKVRPAVRTMIGKINELYIRAYDKDPTTSENKFWVDYVYNGEVNNEADLTAAINRAAITGRKPALTPRNRPINLDTLKLHWFPYLFYFVHQKEPSAADQDYWFGRIKSGDRDTIEELGGTLQWLKENTGQTRR
jgi:hypothetical protein